MKIGSQLPKEESSYWLDGGPAVTFPELKDDIGCDVVIIGGGIAGLTTAYRLKKAGFKVVVIEKNTIGSGTTGGTTGKVTTQHGLIYAELVEHFGRKTTRQYAEICQKAFDDIEALVRKEKIDCDWQIADNFVYSTDTSKVVQLKAEAKTAVRAGLPASFVTTSNLPFAIAGAVKFSGQANFHAVKYVRALADLVQGGGSHVFEHSEAKNIREGQPCKIKTQHAEITAQYIVVATKVPAAPLVGRLTYAAAEYPVTSYVVAGKYDGDLKGMYISPDKQHYSIMPINTPKGRLLLIGGESHIPGIKRPVPNHKKLAAYMTEQFDIIDIRYRWKAMDYIAYDSLPLVGKLYPWSKHAFMVGGFKKWGLNLSMAAANTMVELLTNQEGESTKLFSPHRASAPLSIPKATIKYFK